MIRRALLGILFAACNDGDYQDDVREPPPIAHDDHVTVQEDATGGVTLADMIENDEHVRGATLDMPPLHGRMVLSGSQHVYVPEPGYHGPDRFTYIGRNQHGEASTATVFVEVISDGIAYEQSMELDDASAADLAIGDLTGDGLVDLVTCDPQSSSIVVLANLTASPLAFAASPQRFEGGHTPDSVAVVDIDGDGSLDVITASRLDGMVVLRNRTAPNAALAFDAPVYVPAGEAVSVVAVDLNGDGAPDLAAADRAGDRMHVRLNTSTPGTVAFGADFVFAVPDGPTRILASDADGDGRADLAVLARTAGALSLFVNAMALGDTVPAFQSRIDRATGTNPTMMFLANLDADAREEIGVLHDNDVLWLYANRAGGAQPIFEAARVLSLPYYDTSVVAPADLDGDGTLDLVAAASRQTPFSYLLNRSPGTGAYEFETVDVAIGSQETKTRATFGRPTAVRFVDLDGVAPLELAVASVPDAGNAGVRILFGP